MFVLNIDLIGCYICPLYPLDVMFYLYIFQVLRLVHYLVLFGFYDKSEDIKQLLEPLMSLLDGRNDKPYPDCTGKSLPFLAGLL